MKKPNFLKKITIIDLIIIICIIGAVGFALFHISPSSNSGESISYDSSTTDKIIDKYSSFYREGNIIKTTVGGINSSSGENIELEGTIVWINQNINDKTLKILIDSNGEKLLGEFYEYNSNADIYIDHISLETNGEKYNNTKEITIEPITTNQLSDLIKGINNISNYEISTTLSLNNLDMEKYQKLNNEIYKTTKRPAFEALTNNQLKITSATNEEINIGNTILNPLNSQSDYITIRIYNCSDDDINTIKNNYNITSIRNIT